MGNRILKINVCYRYPENKSPYLVIMLRRLLIFSEGKGNGNAWAYRDKISLYAEIAMI
nr:MAG TPA: hypothetical protein [Caudoviricetes sp.]